MQQRREGMTSQKLNWLNYGIGLYIQLVYRLHGQMVDPKFGEMVRKIQHW